VVSGRATTPSYGRNTLFKIFQVIFNKLALLVGLTDAPTCWGKYPNKFGLLGAGIYENVNFNTENYIKRFA